jgi:hypothetical protein
MERASAASSGQSSPDLSLHSKDGSRKLDGPYRPREEAQKRQRPVQSFKTCKDTGEVSARRTELSQNTGII